MDMQVATPRFTIGRTLKDIGSIFARNVVPFVGMIIAVQIILLLRSLIPLDGAISTRLWVNASIELASNHLSGAVIAAVVLFGTIEGLRGRKPSFGDVRRGLSSVHLFFAGNVLLGLPGFIETMIKVFFPADPSFMTIVSAALYAGTVALFLMWGLFAPATAIEGRGLLYGLRRSQHLLKGHRWRVIGLLVTLGVVWAAALAAITQVFGDPVARQIAGPYTSWTGLGMLTVAATFGVVMNILPIVVYYRIRVEKEGPFHEDTVGVFD